MVVFGTGLTDAHDSELAPGVKANEPIRDEIERVTGTFMYDRAGLGQSDPLRLRSGAAVSRRPSCFKSSDGEGIASAQEEWPIVPKYVRHGQHFITQVDPQHVANILPAPFEPSPCIRVPSPDAGPQFVIG